MQQKSKVKVLFRHRSMEMGGVEKVLLSLLNNLDREKFDFTVLLNLNQGELRDEIPAFVKKIYIAKGKEEMSKNPLVQKLQLLKRRGVLNNYRKNRTKADAEILQNEKFDVEVAMDWRDFEPVINSPNKFSKKIGWFHSEVDTKGFEPLLPLVLDSFPKFDHVVYCSEKIKNIMHRCYPDLDYPSESVIINAMPIAEIRKKAEEQITDFPFSNVPVFISVGRLHTRKGYHKLMEAHAKLLKDGFPHKVIILGSGEELENLTKQRSELKVEDSFILAGNRMNPYPYLKKADYFIMPSQSEAWPLVLAEALILKKPTIATDTGDVATILDHEKTGLLIKYGVDEMYTAMKRFLTDDKLLKEIEGNLEQIDNKFDSEKIFGQVSRLFSEITIK